MPSGAVVSPHGDILTAAPPPRHPAKSRATPRTDEQINGDGFRPLASGENFESIRAEIAQMRRYPAVTTALGMKVGVLGARDAKKIAYSTKPGENTRAHQYAAKNILPLAARAEVAVRQDNYKRHGKGSGPGTYVRLFAPFVHDGHAYVAVIAQYEADANGIHAVEVKNVIRADGTPEVVSRETQRDAMPTGRPSAPNAITIPQSGPSVNDLSVDTIARLIDNPDKGAAQHPRLLTKDASGTIVEPPTDATAVAGRVADAIRALLARPAGAGAQAHAAVTPPPETALGLFDLIRSGETQVRNVPVADIQVNRDIKQFKRDADPRTGVVADEALEGEWQPIPAKPILLLEKPDGTLEVVTGRHRLDLARRNGLATIPANVIRMADGWTLDMARALDAYDNILDEKGSDQDFIQFFRDSRLPRADAQAKGLLARRKGRDAYDVAEHASEDLYALAMGDARMDAPTAAAIAREAPRGVTAWNANIQRAVARAVLEDGLRADDAAIMARSLRQAYAQRAQTATAEQLDLFGADDTFILAMTVEAKFAAQQIRQIDFDLRGLKTAAGKQSGNLAARDTLIRKYGLKGPEDREGMARAIATLETQKRRWQNYHTDPELAELAHAHAKRSLRLEAIEEEAAAEATQSVARESPTVDRESPAGQSPAPQPAPAAEAAPANRQVSQSANQPAAQRAEPRVLPAATMRDAKAHVDKLAEDKVEVSTLNGDTLRFSKQIKKAYSKAAENQSDDRAAHWAAVAALEHLCQSADHIFKEPPRNGSADIAYYHKYAAPFVHGGVGYIAKITAKEYPRQTARGVYSVEAVSLERIGDRGIHASIANGQTLDPVATDKIAQMAERVKRFLDQPAPAPEAAPITAAHGSHAAARPRDAPGGLLVLAVPLGPVLPRLHEPRCHLVHVLPLVARRVRDDAVVERHPYPALVGQLGTERPLHREQRAADARDRALQGVLVAAHVAHERRVVGRHLRGGLHVPRPLVYVEVLEPEPAQVAEGLQRDAQRPLLRLGSERRRELVDRVLRAHDLAEHRTVSLAEGDGHARALAVPLDVEHHVRQEHPHLPVVYLAHHRVVAEVHGLDGVHRVREHALPVGAHVHPRVVDGGLDYREGWPLRARLVHRAHALGLHPVPVLIEAHRDDPIATLLSIIR